MPEVALWKDSQPGAALIQAGQQMDDPGFIGFGNSF
jgi:hypothetical protein|tara:strand:- start:174 stop:281 length:108 start_codon:yes stop_codon:yes gene_type:complete